jgi:hypothetical protein
MKSIIRYIVKNAKGEYQSAYSTKLGNDKAFKYATLTARDVFGVIYSVDASGNDIDGNETEVTSFPKPDKKNRKIKQKSL